MRELFGDRVESLDMARKEYVERAASPATTSNSSSRRSGRWSVYELSPISPTRGGLDRDFREFATRENRGAPDGPASTATSYVLLLARKT